MKMNQDNVTDVQSKSPSTPLEKVDQSLSAVFGTLPIEVPATEVTQVTHTLSDAPAINGVVEADHAFARSNMYSLLQQGQDALGYALELAKATESPRGFEVVAAMMKNLADMNMQMMDLHEKKARIIKPVPQAEPQKTVNNTVVFNGTTAEINKMLNDMKKEQ